MNGGGLRLSDATFRGWPPGRKCRPRIYALSHRCLHSKNATTKFFFTCYLDRPTTRREDERLRVRQYPGGPALSKIAIRTSLTQPGKPHRVEMRQCQLACSRRMPELEDGCLPTGRPAAWGNRGRAFQSRESCAFGRNSRRSGQYRATSAVEQR